MTPLFIDGKGIAKCEKSRADDNAIACTNVLTKSLPFQTIIEAEL